MADFFSVEHLNVLREFIAHGIILLGALFVVVGSVGVLRFPDFYTRMHAASVTDTLGATLVIAGMMLLALIYLQTQFRSSGAQDTLNPLQSEPEHHAEANHI